MSKTIAASRLTQEQQAEVKRRLADPNPIYAAPAKVREFFSRFGRDNPTVAVRPMRRSSR